MSLDYERYYEDGWKNKPDRSTPVVAEALNNIDNAIIETQEAIKGIGGKNVASAKMSTGQITDAFDGSAIVTDFEKNLIPFPYYNTSDDFFTVNEDGSVTANGTVSGSNKQFRIFEYNVDNSNLLKCGKKYRVSGMPEGIQGSNSTVYMMFAIYGGKNGSDIKARQYLYSSEANYFLDLTNVTNFYNVYGFIMVVTGQTLNNVTFKPMFVEVAEDGSYQEEYIPSSGYDVTFELNELNSNTIHVDSKTELPVLGLETYEGITNVISPFEISFDYPTSKDGAYILDGYSIAKQNERKLEELDSLMTTMLDEEV